jgi:hypothetical protein
MRQIKPLYPENNSRVDLIKELIGRDDFALAVEKIRRKWKINTSLELHLWEDNAESIKQNELLDDTKFRSDLIKLQKKFGLGDQWTCFIEEYIFIDAFVYKQTSNFFIEKRTGNDADSITGAPAYYIRIFPETTKNDIDNAWGEINNFIHESKSKPKRQKLSKNFERDKKIWKLAKDGFRIEDIQRYFLEEHRKHISFDAIKMADLRHRKRMKIKNGNKLGYIKKGALPLSQLQILGANYPDND